LEELIDDLNTCEDETYLALQQITSLKEQVWRLRKLIDGYIRYLRERKDGSSAHENSPVYHVNPQQSDAGIDMTEDPGDSRFRI
jgi:hypothetical protein